MEDKIIFCLCVFYGISILMPWNMFITAKSYFIDYKFNDDVKYASYFLQYLTFVSQIPNLTFTWLNVFINLKQKLKWIILGEIVVFLLTTILVELDTSLWTFAFFWITMASVVLLNTASGILENTIYGMVAKLPQRYTGAVVIGSNMSGLVVSIVSFLSIFIFASQKTAALYYFVSAMIILVVSLVPLKRFYNFYNSFNVIRARRCIHDRRIAPYWEIFKKAKLQLFNVFMVFVVTLSIFPALYSDIMPVDDSFPIPKEYFTGITCFITFNLFAMLGNITTTWIKWPQPRYLIILVLMRLVFIPLFIFCNYQPTGVMRELPVFISNDWAYWFIGIAMSYSSGYLSSLGMMYAPQTVEPQYQNIAGKLSGAFLVTGVFVGILISFVFPKIV